MSELWIKKRRERDLHNSGYPRHLLLEDQAKKARGSLATKLQGDLTI